MIIQVTPRGMLNTFFRHRYKFASIFLVVFGLAVAYCVVATPKFESDAALLVKFASNQPSRSDSPPSVGITAQQLERKEIVNSQMGVLQSQDVIADVLNNVTIRALYPTLMAIPDGLMLNYWLRSPNPTRHVYFVPWSLAFADGKAAVLAGIQQHAPDFIAVIHRKAEQYGFTFFGADERFGAPIMRWVRANYRRVQLSGLEPLTGRGFGVLLMSYNSPPPGNRK